MKSLKTIKKSISIFILLISISVLSSCLKTDTNKNNENNKLTDLVIPDGFTWSTSRKVTLKLSSTKPVKLAAFLNESCSQNKKIVECLATNQQDDPLILSVPNEGQKLFLKYEKSDGEYKIIPLEIPSNNIIQYVVPEDAKAAKTTIQGTKANYYGETGIIYYPSEGWGTILFEDLFPDKGDYDFNDFVANYKLQLYLQNWNKAYGAMIGLNVNAVGGQLPYQMYLQLDGVTTKEIDNIEVLDGNIRNCDNFICELISSNDPNSPAIIAFRNIEKNPNKQENSKYINTEKDYKLSYDQLVSVSIMVYFKNSINLINLSEDKFNFFLAKGNSSNLEEIHVSGYAPSKFGINMYNNLKKNSSNLNPNDSRYYYSKDNFTWGLLVPDNIPHTYESVDFIKAYPKFRNWAVSGGREYANWYDIEYREEQYLINY